MHRASIYTNLEKDLHRQPCCVITAGVPVLKKVKIRMSHPLPKSSAGAIEKDQILEKLTLMCARDLRPFNIVQGVGFREFAECCVAIGATHGRRPCGY